MKSLNPTHKQLAESKLRQDYKKFNKSRRLDGLEELSFECWVRSINLLDWEAKNSYLFSTELYYYYMRVRTNNQKLK
jgi:hypothetical protein